MKSLERNPKWYSKALECERNGIGIDSAYLGTSQKFNVRCSVLGVSRRSRWDKSDKFSEIIICSNIQSVNWAVNATTSDGIVRILMKMKWFRCVIKYILVDSATKQPTCQCNLGVKTTPVYLYAIHWHLIEFQMIKTADRSTEMVERKSPENFIWKMGFIF